MRTKSKAMHAHPTQVQGYEANNRQLAYARTGQKHDPAFCPLFFSPPKNAQVLAPLRQLQEEGQIQSDQRGEIFFANPAMMRGPGGSATTQNLRSSQLKESGERSKAKATWTNAQQTLTPAWQSATMHNLSPSEDTGGPDMQAHGQLPQTKRVGRQQQQLLSQQPQGIPLLPCNMREAYDGAQQTQQVQHTQQMQQLLAYPPDKLSPSGTGWFQTYLNQNCLHPGRTFCWMPNHAC
eukprot:TRINITY_DN880_c0_g2_i1.p1 TRINITY_DN880_c0_g2~~TRINITY_DN880_c0_g2_i1.p1  ORF type:complete len:236 (-),score=41.39 TRINITY_DN880_c0_g2_i1:941-1648(-)